MWNNFLLKKTKGWLGDNYISGKQEENDIKAGRKGWLTILS